MTFRPRQYEDDIYPDDEFDQEYPEYEPDPDHLRDLQMEREWMEGLAEDHLDDPRPDLMFHPTGGWVDEYMVKTYGGGRGPGS